MCAMEDTQYQNALDYIYSFVDYSLTRQLRYSPEKFNLDRMVHLMDLLGNPHRAYRVIHVAGTKGKGSTSAMMACALHAQGYRVGLFTSPHLQEYTERIQVNETQISKADFTALVEEIKPFVAQVEKLTTFEITTALGFLYFARQNVDVAVIEVGLGGRLDATNVVDPLVSVITALSFDHMNVLGNSIVQIASEKAGIIKPGRPVILSPQMEIAREVVEKIARERGCRYVQVGKDWLFAPWSHSLDGQTLLVWSAQDQAFATDYVHSGGRSDWEPVRLNIPLLGMHQVENAATAYAALQVARDEGLEIKENAIRSGFEAVQWPARFEILRREPPVVTDSAHNPDSALRLRLAMDDYLNGKPIILVFGASEDKDIEGMFKHLMPRVRQVVATKSAHPRAMDPAEIVRLAHQFGKPAQATESVEEALSAALKCAGQDAAVVITGSVFVAAAGREVWYKRVWKQNHLTNFPSG